MMKVLVCGDRNWEDYEAIARELCPVRPSVVIHGAARGADSIAGEIAEEMGVRVEDYLAEWDKFGRAAGPIRNQQMLDEGKPDLVLAFHPDISKSKGTADMVRRAQKAGVPTKVFSS
jgi:hypothetical protein